VSREAEQTERRLQQAILSLLEDRSVDATICPSEAARRVGGADWRPLMGPVRDAARRLAEEGRVEVRQHGRRVDPALARGPVRIARASTPPR